MDPLVVIVLSCLILGSVVGVLAGMLGIGGGLIIVPALSYLLIHFMGMTTETAAVISHLIIYHHLHRNVVGLRTLQTG